jgi:hypothetical protein
MGELYIHELNPYIEKYKCTVFVETGTGVGTGVSYALQHDFKKLYSIEYMAQLYEKCKKSFVDKRLNLIHSDSLTGLEEILNKTDEEEVMFFWLDAHFPGADFHFNSYDHLKDQPELHMPLKEEVKLIKEMRPQGRDVIFIDDLQIYEDGPFELLNQDFKDKYGDLGTEFINEAFAKTHDFSRDYRHQGFLIITPKELENEV